MHKKVFSFIDARNVVSSSPGIATGADSERAGTSLPPPTGSAQGFLGGAACLVIWGALWLLLILALAGRFQWAGAPPSESVNGSAFVVPELPSCLPDFIELDGQCVLAEETVVGAPPGWRRP